MAISTAVFPTSLYVNGTSASTAAWTNLNISIESAATSFVNFNYAITPAVTSGAWMTTSGSPNQWVRAVNFNTHPLPLDEARPHVGIAPLAEREEGGHVIPTITFEESERQYRERNEARRASEREAERVAEALLLEHLTPEQREQYRVAKEFMVISESGKRFKIATGYLSRNIFELDKQGRKVRRYCIHPQDDFPLGDALLAQKLMLEGAEREFMNIANMTPC